MCSAILPWYKTEILGPNVEKQETLLELAKMTNDAYVTPDDSQWYELGKNWSNSFSKPCPFGWELDADGFQGHAFVTPDISTIILSIKGASVAVGRRRIDWSWTTICGCYHGGWQCDQDCLEQALVEDSLFYPLGTNLYNNLTYMYPTLDIWIIGHSLVGDVFAHLGEKVVQWLPFLESHLVSLPLPLSHQGSIIMLCNHTVTYLAKTTLWHGQELGPELSIALLEDWEDNEPEPADEHHELQPVEGPIKAARALYNFEGKAEFRELTVEAGDELNSLKEEAGDGWSLVR
ncbi:hypothetical protein BDR06DRAFT_1057840 [Suillus hirtellus]|nr:hypothetical protein BDR06DRAFT_1057840 [Suillus hirtellus]